MNKHFIFPALLVASAFWACGDDSSANSSEPGPSSKKLEEVGSIFELGKCVKDRKGEVIFVVDEGKDFICVSDRWIAEDDLDGVIASSSSAATAISSSDESISSSSKTVEKLSSSSNPVSISSSSESEIVSSSSEPVVISSSSESVTVSSSSESEIVSSSSEPAVISSCSESVTISSSSEVVKSSSSNETGSDSSDSFFDQPGKDDLIDTRDGKFYKTVKIGGDVWMAENLNYSGDEIKGVCYDRDPENCTRYGRLYTWENAMKACPTGWHLPIYFEWVNLMQNVSGNTLDKSGTFPSVKNAGLHLKSSSGWFSSEYYRGNGLDSFGFKALPGGFMTDDGKFGGIQMEASFWTGSSNGGSTTESIKIDINYVKDEGFFAGGKNSGGMSVRCIKSATFGD